MDDNNAAGVRPQEITLRLFQNDLEIDSLPLDTSDDTVNTITYTFGERTYLDDAGLPYVCRVEEDVIPDYTATITGYNILNRYDLLPFSFTKTNARTTVALKDPSFELLQSGTVQATALSDDDGLVSFQVKTGNYQLQETQSPVGFMDNTTVYQVAVGANNMGGLIGQETEIVTLLNSYNVGDIITEASANMVYLGGISNQPLTNI